AIGGHPLPPFVEVLVPAGAAHSRTAALILAVGMLIGLTVVRQIQGLISSLLRTYTGEKLVLDFRTRLFGHAQRLSLAYHDMSGTADSIYRIQYDASAIEYVSLDGVVPFFRAGFTLVAMLYITLRIDWQFALVALTVSPGLYWVSQASRRCWRVQSREVKTMESAAMAVVQEVLSAVRVVKAFGREDHEQDRYMRRSADILKARIRLGLAEGRFSLIIGLITSVGTAAALWLGVRHV